MEDILKCTQALLQSVVTRSGLLNLIRDSVISLSWNHMEILPNIQEQTGDRAKEKPLVSCFEPSRVVESRISSQGPSLAPAQATSATKAPARPRPRLGMEDPMFDEATYRLFSLNRGRHGNMAKEAARVSSIEEVTARGSTASNKTKCQMSGWTV